MSFEVEATLPGSKYKYRLTDKVKRFTLRDNGFVETKAGNFQFLRPLEATPQSKEGFLLKITVDKNIKLLKLSTTSKNGLRAVNIFKDDQNQMIQEKFYFLLEGLVDREVLSKEEV